MHSMRNTILTAMIMLLVTACSGKTLKQSWVAENPGPAVQKVLVIAIMQSDTLRKQFEIQMAERIKTLGANAVPGHRIISDKNKGNEDDIRKAAQEQHVDAVLLTQVIDINQQKTSDATIYVSSGYPAYGFGYGGGWYNNYYGATTSISSQQNAYSVARIETSLFRLGVKEPIWSALSETISLNSGTANINKVSKALASKMKRDGLI